MMQMETKEALECVEDICAVPGLDSIVYGGMDWSGSLGFPHLPTWDLIEKEPEMLAACDSQHKWRLFSGFSIENADTRWNYPILNDEFRLKNVNCLKLKV